MSPDETGLTKEELPGLALETLRLVDSALEIGDDEQVLALLPGLVRVMVVLPSTFPGQRANLIEDSSRILQSLLPTINLRARDEGSGAATLEVKAELAWQALLIVTRLRESGTHLPNWLDGYESGLAQHGAMLLRKIRDQDPINKSDSFLKELVLLLRMGELLDPPPSWVILDSRRLLVQQITDALHEATPSEGMRAGLRRCAERFARFATTDSDLDELLCALDALPSASDIPSKPSVDVDKVAAHSSGADAEALEEEAMAVVPDVIGVNEGLNSVSVEELARQIPESVEQWLASLAPQSTAELALVHVPGARVVPHERGRLQLNLAPLLSCSSTDRIDDLIQAFFRPLQDAAGTHTFSLLEPTSSLYESLGLFWRHGGQLDLDQFSLLTFCTTSWNRCGGPGALGARLLPPQFPVARLAAGHSVVRPLRVELEALQAVLYHHDALEPAMATIRRNHLNPEWMHRRTDPLSFDPSDVEGRLRLLHTKTGFYADSYAPLECLERWSRGVLSALLDMQVAGARLSPTIYPLAQSFFEQTGRVKPLLQWPGHQEIYDFLAGKEVVFVTPLAVDVEAHHRSGKAFDLFHDLTIRPYGLRCVEAPLSLYPNRPLSGFSESLDRCLEAVDTLYSQRPFTIFMAACGSYALPLCEAVKQRYGVSCLYNGNLMHAYVGLHQTSTAQWRLESRKQENWTTSHAFDEVVE